MSKYLLEIGTEELPYKFIPQAVEQLEKGFEDFFKANNVSCSKPKVFATPRRLAVIVKDLAEKQPDVEKIVKGPIKKVAYDENGNLTQAGKGFLNKNGLNEKDAYIQDDYLHAKVFSKGKLTSELLQENVAQLVLKLQGPYFMRWAANDEKFSRPIRWIVSILDDKELPVQIVGVKSSRISQGHRFSENVNVEIPSADEFDYIKNLKDANVLVRSRDRRNAINKLVHEEVTELGLIPIYRNDLLDELIYLCEWPVPCVCEFNKKYLDIPEMVIIEVMAKHQRYIALKSKEHGLSNKFITITNYNGKDFTNIRAGNERVITARLEDAIFFFNEDISNKKLSVYVDKLVGMTFQKNMGSMLDKKDRIIKLSKIIANKTGNEASLKTIERTAELCKADLATKLVFEFPELQGFIGSDYAEISGEDDKVCKGIYEHYYPITATCTLAEGIEGQIVGIADKLDTICAVFANGKKPTGSSDPLGVRRAALGIIRTILDNNFVLDLSQLLSQVINLLEKFKGVFRGSHKIADKWNDDEVKADVEEFFKQRLIIFLSDSYRKDILEACSKNKNPLENLLDFVERVANIEEIINTPEFAKIHESANRIQRIIKEDVNAEIKADLLNVDAEKVLYQQIKTIKSGNYAELVESLIAINPAIEKFFEDVLVMDDNEEIKQNRLAMLTKLKKYYNQIADFSALQM